MDPLQGRTPVVGPPPRGMLGALFLGVLMAALDIAIVGPALPALQAHFSLDERQVAWVISAFVLANLVGVPLMARLSDLFGRRSVFVLDVGLFATGAVVVAASPAFGVLLVGRVLQGFGASGIFPVASAVVGDAFPPERQGAALGVLGAVFGVAFLIGPVSAGILLNVASWPWLFLLNLPLAALALAFGWRLLPATRPPVRHRLDGRGLLLLTGLLLALAYGLNQIDTEALGASLVSARVWLSLLGAAALLFLFIRHEQRVAAPLIRPALFRSRQVRLAVILAAGTGLSEATFSFFSVLAVTAFAVDPSTASYMLLPLFVAVAFGSPVMGRLLDQRGPRTVVLICCGLLTIGLLAVAFGAGLRGLFYAGSVLIGLGIAGLLGSALNYILLQESDASERAVAQGMITLFVNVGILLGASLIGAIVASGGGSVAGFQTAFLFLAGLSAGLFGLALRLKR